MLTNNSCVSKNSGIPYRMIEEEVIMVDVEKGEVMHLNEAGAKIWSQIDGKKTIAEIAGYLCDKFEVDQDTAQKDVVEFLSKLGEKGVVSY